MPTPTFFSSYQQTLPEDLFRGKVDLKEKLSSHNMKWGEGEGGPPASWKEGAPIGNGDFGALIYGFPDNLSFALSKTNIWDRSGEPKSNFKGNSFADIRQIYENRDTAEFARLCELPEVDHKQHATTAGMFRLHLHDADSVTSAEMQVLLYDGVATLEFTPAGIDTNFSLFGKTRAEFLLSRSHQVMALRLAPSRDRPQDKPDITARAQDIAQKAPLGTIFWELSRNPHAPHKALATGRIGDMIWLKQAFVNGDHYVVAFTTVGSPMQQESLRHRICGDIAVSGTDEVEIYLTIVSNSDTADPLSEAQRRLNNAVLAGYSLIRREHCHWWHDYWKRSWVSVSDMAVEKWWYTSLYICGATIDPGKQSPGLQGVWIKENVPAWFGDYHSNVNLQAVYWGLFGANRVDMIEPYIRLLKNLEPQARRDTKEYFGMRGLRFPHAASIDGYELTTRDWTVNLGVSVGGSSWLTQLAWQVFEYTGDHALLKETIYPLLRDVALFYEDYLRWDKEGRRWVAEPSLFFEVLCPRFSSWGRNSLYELALIRAALERAITAAKELDADSTDRQRWQMVLERLSDFPVDENGENWIGFEGREDLRQFGWHQFALPPVFPAELVSLWHGPERWRALAQRTVSNPLTRYTHTGKSWCGGQGIRELIRMGFVEEAWSAARWTSLPPDNINGLNHKWSQHFLQADHAPGMCSVLNDMLLLAPGGVIRLFCSVPKSESAAFHSLRAPGAFLVSAEKSGEEVDYAVIQSLAGRDLHIANPWKGQARLRDLKTMKVVCCSEASELHCKTAPNQVLLLDLTTRPYEELADNK